MLHSGMEVRGLRKRLSSGDRWFELEIPELKVGAREIVGLSGKSGSGKSTFLDLIAMLSVPDEVDALTLGAGEALVDLKAILERGNDREISETRLEKMGYILQHGGLLGFLTTRANIELPFKLANLPIDSEFISAVANAIGMTEQLDKFPSALSGGQRQRVSVMRALCTKPAIILCDEPTASVDEFTARSILQQLALIAKHSGSSVLLVSHDQELISQFADRKYEMVPQNFGNGTRSTVREVRDA